MPETGESGRSEEIAAAEPDGGGRRGGVAERQARKAEKRAAILAGAVRVFAEKGFFNATVAEIARAAGVADGTIYLYFKSKDDLLLSVFDEQMALLVEQARAAVADAPTSAEALRRVAELHLASVERYPAMASVLIVELRQSNTFVRKPSKPRLAEYLDVIAQIVQRGQAAGEFEPDIHPAAVKRALFGALDEIALSWLLARNKFDLGRTAAEVAAMFVRGLTRSPAAAQQPGPAGQTAVGGADAPAPAGASGGTGGGALRQEEGGGT